MSLQVNNQGETRGNTKEERERETTKIKRNKDEGGWKRLRSRGRFKKVARGKNQRWPARIKRQKERRSRKKSKLRRSREKEAEKQRTNQEKKCEQKTGKEKRPKKKGQGKKNPIRTDSRDRSGGEGGLGSASDPAASVFWNSRICWRTSEQALALNNKQPKQQNKKAMGTCAWPSVSSSCGSGEAVSPLEKQLAVECEKEGELHLSLPLVSLPLPWQELTLKTQRKIQDSIGFTPVHMGQRTRMPKHRWGRWATWSKGARKEDFVPCNNCWPLKVIFTITRNMMLKKNVTIFCCWFW